MGLLAITGVTGELGGRVVTRLARDGAQLRLVARDPSRLGESPAGPVVRASYQDGAAMRAALDGVATLFLVSASEAADRIAQHRTAIDAAVLAGVHRIVYVSFLAAAPNATFTFARDHYATEAHIRATGLDFTFLRDSLYLDFAPRWVSADGVLAGPAGDGQVAWVSRDDIADVAAAVLTGTGHSGESYDVTGQELLTMAQTAERIGTHIGRPVRYQPETLAQARAARAGYGAPDWEVEGWVTSYAAVATGELAVCTDVVRRITGHRPQTLDEYLDRHPESYRHIGTTGR